MDKSYEKEKRHIQTICIQIFYLDYVGKGTLKGVFSLATSVRHWVRIRKGSTEPCVSVSKESYSCSWAKQRGHQYRPGKAQNPKAERGSTLTNRGVRIRHIERSAKNSLGGYISLSLVPASVLR